MAVVYKERMHLFFCNRGSVDYWLVIITISAVPFSMQFLRCTFILRTKFTAINVEWTTWGSNRPPSTPNWTKKARTASHWNTSTKSSTRTHLWGRRCRRRTRRVWRSRRGRWCRRVLSSSTHCCTSNRRCRRQGCSSVRNSSRILSQPLRSRHRCLKWHLLYMNNMYEIVIVLLITDKLTSPYGTQGRHSKSECIKTVCQHYNYIWVA